MTFLIDSSILFLLLLDILTTFFSFITFLDVLR